MGYNADTMSFEVPNTDTVYISGLPAGTTESGKPNLAVGQHDHPRCWCGRPGRASRLRDAQVPWD
jgi:hypothetical protein